MTLDDDNSIYVGGLPYTATEDTLSRVFAPYGSIIAVKIVNDHSSRGKCYGFVTFRNPRSVIDAIHEMDGKFIDGRVVRVNEVTTRGGRSNSGRERFRPNQVRGMDSGTGRNQERNYDRERYKYREPYSDRSRERARSRDNVEDSERQYELTLNHDRRRNDFLDGDRSRGRDLVGHDREDGKNSHWSGESGRDLRKSQDWEMNGTNGDHRILHKEIDQPARNQYNSGHNDREGSGHSSESSGDYRSAAKEDWDKSVQRRSELQNEISEMERRLADKQKVVLDLQKKTLILEDAVITAKKRTSQQKMHLTKLQKCFLQVKEYSERLKSCEEELQWLVNSTTIDGDLADDVGIREDIR